MSAVDFAPSVASLKMANRALPVLSQAGIDEVEVRLTTGDVSRADIAAARRIMAPGLDPKVLGWSFQTAHNPEVLGVDMSKLSDADKKRAEAIAIAAATVGVYLGRRNAELNDGARQTLNTAALFTVASITALTVDPALSDAALAVGAVVGIVGVKRGLDTVGEDIHAKLVAWLSS
jgi:hypothetical protein